MHFRQSVQRMALPAARGVRLAALSTPTATQRQADGLSAREARPRSWRGGLPARFGIIVFGSALLMLGSAASIPLGPEASSPARELLVVVAAGGGLLLLIAASLPVGPLAHWRRWYPRLRHLALFTGLVLALGTLLMFAGTATMMTQPGGAPYYTDILSLTGENVQQVLTGHNPYTTNSGFRAALARYPDALATPMRGPVFGTGYDHPAPAFMMGVQQRYVRAPATERGAFDPRTLHSYPALSFLIYVPFAWLGIGDILVIHFALYALLCAWLLWRAPIGWRHWGALALLAAMPALAVSVLFGTEVICVALVLAAWHWRHRRWLFAVLLGLACAYKQYAWLFAPLLLLDVLLTYGWREPLKRSAVVLGAFLLPNLPYLLASPGPWFRSLWLPMSEPLFATGTGFIALAIGHIIPYGSPAIYAGLELVALGAILWIYARWRSRLGESGPLLALVPLFFAFRSSPNYFAFAPLLAIYAAQALYPRRAPWSPSPLAVRSLDAHVLRALAPLADALGMRGAALRGWRGQCPPGSGHAAAQTRGRAIGA